MWRQEEIYIATSQQKVTYIIMWKLKTIYIIKKHQEKKQHGKPFGVRCFFS